MEIFYTKCSLDSRVIRIRNTNQWQLVEKYMGAARKNHFFKGSHAAAHGREM